LFTNFGTASRSASVRRINSQLIEIFTKFNRQLAEIVGVRIAITFLCNFLLQSIDFSTTMNHTSLIIGHSFGGRSTLRQKIALTFQMGAASGAKARVHRRDGRRFPLRVCRPLRRRRRVRLVDGRSSPNVRASPNGNKNEEFACEMEKILENCKFLRILSIRMNNRPFYFNQIGRRRRQIAGASYKLFFSRLILRFRRRLAAKVGQSAAADSANWQTAPETSLIDRQNVSICPFRAAVATPFMAPPSFYSNTWFKIVQILDVEKTRFFVKIREFSQILGPLAPIAVDCPVRPAAASNAKLLDKKTFILQLIYFKNVNFLIEKNVFYEEKDKNVVFSVVNPHFSTNKVANGIVDSINCDAADALSTVGTAARPALVNRAHGCKISRETEINSCLTTISSSCVQICILYNKKICKFMFKL
uniref:Uncharacterized protein n=1 Tax=Romanomermis culicivorax TaxID=13658 RepID=A0A915HJM8_ROMCU